MTISGVPHTRGDKLSNIRGLRAVEMLGVGASAIKLMAEIEYFPGHLGPLPLSLARKRGFKRREGCWRRIAYSRLALSLRAVKEKVLLIDFLLATTKLWAFLWTGVWIT